MELEQNPATDDTFAETLNCMHCAIHQRLNTPLWRATLMTLLVVQWSRIPAFLEALANGDNW